MRIDSPVMTSAIATGSFSGSFTGTFDGDIQADSVAYANVTGKPTLVSGSAQVVALVEAGTDSNTFTDADHTKLNGIEASADVTDTANVTSAGALMDSELSEIATVKALTAAGISGSFTAASASFSTRVTANDAKLTANTSNVTSAGALMDSEVTNLAQVKAFDSSDYATAAQGALADSAQQPPSEGAFANGDKTKLDGIEASADVTDTTNVTAAGALMDSEVSSLSGVKTLTVPDSTTISSFGATLVDDANAGAARTTLGVDAAGTDNSTDVSLVTTSHDYLSLSGQAITLGQIDISDDTNLAVSDTTGQTGINLTLSGDTVSGVVSGLGTGATPTFSGLTVSNNVTVNGDLTVLGDATELQVSSLNVEDINITIASGAADSSAANGAGITIAGANESLTWDHGNSRFTFSDDLNVGGNITLTGTVDGRDVATDGTKLDGIESGATADQSNAEIRAAVEAATDSNVFTDADHTKLNGIESSADVTDTANVTSAGALMDSELASIADVKALDQSVISGASPTFGTANMTDASNKRFMSDAQETKLDSVESNADVTDTANVTAAGALMDSELTNLAAVKAINQSLVTTADVRFDSLGIGTAAPGTSGVIRATNDIVAFYSSDERLKDNVEEIPNALDKVESIRGVHFDWNDKQEVYEGHDIGVIAQEVEKVLPEIVEDRDNGYKAVKYEKLTAVLIQAVKELSAKVKELENK
jgi:hypothetical protein